MNIQDLRKEKIAILGLSTEGIASGEFLARQKIPFTVLEKKELPQLGKAKDYLSQWKAEYRLGKNHLDKLADFTLVLRSPGIPLFLPQIRAACSQGVKISSQTKLFLKLCPSPAIGITGTKGKGTTAILTHNILKEEGKRVFLGGNIGKPPLDFLEKLDRATWVILELSSFQLEDFEQSPHIAVVLGLAPDHLAPESPDAPNFHKDEETYYKIKEKMVAFQKQDDVAILNFDDDKVKTFATKTQAQVYYFSQSQKVTGAYISQNKEIILNVGGIRKVIGKTKDLVLPGKHNWWNVCAAVAAGGLAGCSKESIQKAVFSFQGYEHRLELVAEIEGVKYYNDSAATNPEPCVAALKSFEGHLILIAGGSNKGQMYDKLGEAIVQSQVKTVYLIGEMAAKIAAAVRDQSSKLNPPTGGQNSKSKTSSIILAGYPTMEKIVRDCSKLAQKSDIVLLSPACASFDMFINYKDRGHQFKKAVLDLKRERGKKLQTGSI